MVVRDEPPGVFGAGEGILKITAAAILRAVAEERAWLMENLEKRDATRHK